jgi:hypothetical protein
MPPSRDGLALSGWLFADLLLGLLMLFFAANTVGGSPAPTPTATPSPAPMHTVAPTPTTLPRPATPRPVAASATPAPCQPTLVLAQHKLHVAPAPGDAEPSSDQLVAAFRPFAGRHAGLLLTFGHAPAAAAGNDLATRVNTLLRAKLPALFSADTVMEAFHDLDSATPGAVDFQVYLLAPSCH